MQETLIDWQRAILPRLMAIPAFGNPSAGGVTLLAYFFWDDDRIYSEFYRIQCAFLCAFKVLGKLPATLVVNRVTREMEDFCAKYDIRIQTEPTLTGGIRAMSMDCIRNLHARFDTDYVLIIQNDGFPLCGSLKSFVGRYDYVGAPWPGHTRYLDLFPYPAYGVGNGGFSLRSKGICECVADVYRRYLKRIPYNWLFTEDVFYCKTMRFFSPTFRKRFRFPSIRDAARFSVECLTPAFNVLEKPPFGFHSAYGFNQFSKRFGEFLIDVQGGDLLINNKEES